MRTIWAGLIVVSMSGCGLELLTTTAVQGQLAAQDARTAARVLDYAKTTTGQTNAQHAIDLYKADKGQNPPSLEALVPDYLDKVPTKADGTPYGYDATAGKLLDGPSATMASTGASDTQKLQEISAAVQKYGQSTGRFPTSLWALVPDYMAQYPKTSSGQDFLYNPANGGVYLPQGVTAVGSPSAPVQPGARGRGGAGVGPLGEAVTGIGISNQLDNMSNAGASAAQGRAGQSLGRSQAQHDAQQEKALQQLGM